MTSCIVHTRPDGGVSVTTPAPALIMEFARYGRATGTLVWSGPPVPEPGNVMTLEEATRAALAYVREHNLPGGAEYRRRTVEALVARGLTTVDAEATVSAQEAAAAPKLVECTHADLPNSRRFRESWRQTGASPPSVDIPLARVQRMNEVRETRAPKLAKADVDIARAEDSGDTQLTKKLRVYRQALRDLPATSQASLGVVSTPEGLVAWEPSWPQDPNP